MHDQSARRHRRYEVALISFAACAPAAQALPQSDELKECANGKHCAAAPDLRQPHLRPKVLTASPQRDTREPPRNPAHCLYGAVTLGQKKIEPCGTADNAGLASNPKVQHVIATLGLKRLKIRFRECASGAYAAMPMNGFGGYQYEITYPSADTDAHLPAIAHELAHVLQMEMAGGFDALQDKYKHSHKIELGADYVAGIAIAKAAPGVGLISAQKNLLLMAQYYEPAAEAHGPPAHRVSAFRLGYYEAAKDADIHAGEASRVFLEYRYHELF